MHRVIMGGAATYPRIAMLFYERGPAATRLALSAFLRRLVAEGDLRAHDTVFAVWQLPTTARGDFQARLRLGLIDRIPGDERGAHLRRAVDDFMRPCGMRAE
jgi:hypothetical protein